MPSPLDFVVKEVHDEACGKAAVRELIISILFRKDVPMDHEKTRELTDLILEAAEATRSAIGNEPEPGLTRQLKWPRSKRAA